MEINKIKFVCRSNTALTPTYVCGTYSSASWQYKSKIGSMSWPTEIEVPLYVSNDKIKVGFSTSDSNGGSAPYEGAK